jgi:protein-tyrosine-phosphatase
MIENATVHRVGRPLEVRAARERAEQAAALGDELRLRVLSAIASGAHLDELPEILRTSTLQIDAAITALHEVGLLNTDEAGDATLTADAWVRFGRLLSDSSPPLGNSWPVAPITSLPDAIGSVARDLAYRFSSTFSAETVTRYVSESYLLLSQRARVRAHLAPLTARYAADRLDALASAQGLTLRGTPEVLFVCVQNAGRSQIAAAYLRHLAGSAVHVRSAGSDPAAAVHPRVIDTLAEVGIPVSDDFPKPLTDEVVQAADYVVTMGCGDACPVYPGRRYMAWELDDPLALDDEGLRAVRDSIRTRVEGLLDEMGVAGQQARR